MQQHALQSPVVAPEEATSVLSFSVRGCQVLAMRYGSAEFVVMAKTEEGELCKYTAILNVEDGSVFPNALPNFVVAGGWSRGKRVDYGETCKVKNSINVAVVSALAIANRHAAEFPEQGEFRVGWDDILAFLPPGMGIGRGTEDRSNMRRMALLGVRSSIAVCLTRMELQAFVSDPVMFFQRFMATQYGLVVEGEWDDTSTAIAVTSNISAAQCVSMREHGVKLEAPDRY